MSHQHIKFSIVIPSYNRPERLVQCLQSIAHLDFPHECFEVIVVDDGSQIPLEPAVESFKESLQLRVIRQPNAGPASARNTGAEASCGEYLVFTDDDCRPDVNWLKAVETAQVQASEALIGGHTLNALPDNLFSTASQLLIDYLYDYYNSPDSAAMFFASNNFAVPRKLYEQLKGFDTSFPLAAGEDREFCDRWQQYGLPMIYAPAMQIHHSHTLTLASFWRQHFNYGRGAFCFHQLRSKRKQQDMQIEPITFYWRLLTYPFYRRYGSQSLFLSGLFFLSQVANASGFFWEKRQASPPKVAQV